jgi:hypothetical protein
MNHTVKKIANQIVSVYRWDTMNELVVANGRPDNYRWTNDWMGESIADCERKSRHGDSTGIEKAEGLLEDLVLSVETEGREWAYSVGGPRPCIPSAIAGRPDSMRRVVPTEDNHQPVVIVVDITSSGGIRVEDLCRRGTVLLALTMVIARTRPVELYVLSALGGFSTTGINCIRVGTTPMDLSMANYALSSQGLCRGYGYEYLNKHAKTSGGWAFGHHPTGSDRQRYEAKMREALHQPDTDFIFVPPIHLRDELLQDSIAFIHRTVAEIEARAKENK